MPEPTSPFTRRAFLWTTLAGGAAFVIAACSRRQAASPTPAATAVPSAQASPEASQVPSATAAAVEAPSEPASTGCSVSRFTPGFSSARRLTRSSRSSSASSDTAGAPT